MNMPTSTSSDITDVLSTLKDEVLELEKAPPPVPPPQAMDTYAPKRVRAERALAPTSPDIHRAPELAIEGVRLYSSHTAQLVVDKAAEVMRLARMVEDEAMAVAEEIEGKAKAMIEKMDALSEQFKGVHVTLRNVRAGVTGEGDHG